MQGHKLSLLCILMVFLPAVLYAAEYAIPEIRVEVSINEQGIVEIREDRTYRFDGSFSWADYRLPKHGFTDIKNIRISEGDIDYINDNSEETGTFSVSENNSTVAIKWHYSAEDETRTFTVSYELAGALVIGPDWTEFFWNYLGPDRDKSTEILQTGIHLPGPVPPDSIHVWTRVTEDSIEITKNRDLVAAHASRIPRNQSVQIRLLFPSTLLTGDQVSVTDPGLTLDWVLQNEEEYQQKQVEEAEKVAFYRSITPGVTLLIMLLSAGVFIFYYRKYGKRFSSATVSQRETVVIPEYKAPALVGRLVAGGAFTSRQLVATLLDLSRRGWFTIHEEKKKKKGIFTSSETSQFRISRNSTDPAEHLPAWEQMVVSFAEKRISGGKNSITELFKASDTEVTKWYSAWTSEMKRVFEEQQWIDTKSYNGAIQNGVIQLLLMSGGFSLFVMGGIFALAAVATTLLTGLASFGIIRRTQSGEETYRRWKAYRDGLKNADKRTIRMDTLDRHFIYATALHLSKKQLDNLIETGEEESVHIFTWIILMKDSPQSPAALASSLSTLAATGTSSFAGTTGGAGAVSGAAGGGATGGAG